MSLGFHVKKLDKNDITDHIENLWKQTNQKVAQIFSHGPRNKKRLKINITKLKSLIDTKKTKLYVHTTYATSWKNTDDTLEHIYDQIIYMNNISTGLVIHIPKDIPENVINKCDVIMKYIREKAKDTKINQKLLLEVRSIRPSNNSYETAKKLKVLIDGLKRLCYTPRDIGFVIDTAHIYIGGIDMVTSKEANAYLQSLEPIKEWIQLLHLNGNQFNRDKRAGDKHIFPGTPNDQIWKDDQSGLLKIYKWFKKNKIDIILEVPQSKENINNIGLLKK